MGISFGSINTGLPKDIVKQIIEAEKIPIKKMEARKGKVVKKKELVAELTKHMEELRDLLIKNSNEKGLSDLKVDTNKELLNVVVDKAKAKKGSYQIEIIRKAQKSSAMTSASYDRKDSYFGVGYIQYELPDGTEKEIFVDPEHSSLDGIAKLINQNEELGLTATVVNDGSGKDAEWRMILALNDTGDESVARFPYFYFVDGEEDFYLDMQREAQDALIKIDGFPVEVPGNKVSDIIPGVTFDLRKAKPGEEFTLNIDTDEEAVTAKIEEIVVGINKVLKFIRDQNTMDQHTDTTSTLGGDITLQQLESRMRSAIFTGVKTQTGIKRFGDMGVSFNRSGVLEIDKNRFQANVTADYGGTSQILTGYVDEKGVRHEGFLTKLQQIVSRSLANPAGILANRKRGLESKIRAIDRQIEQREKIIDRKEKLLKDKFARLESTISQIKTQGAGLAGLASGGGQIAQLTGLGQTV